jgi:hypothetical protein
MRTYAEPFSESGSADELGWSDFEPTPVRNLTTSLMLIVVAGVYGALSCLASGLSPMDRE